jgi:hypothetical protein
MKIIGMPLKKLCEQVRDGHLKEEDVRNAFLMRALVAVDSNYLAALRDAKQIQEPIVKNF